MFGGVWEIFPFAAIATPYGTLSTRITAYSRRLAFQCGLVIILFAFLAGFFFGLGFFFVLRIVPPM
jgi:hypothetical protein